MVVNKNTFQQRLELACDHAGVPGGRARRAALVKRFKVSGESIRKWLSGEARPIQTRIEEIAQAFDINGEWLLTGRGSMTGQNAGAIIESEMPIKDRKLLEEWHKLPPTLQNYIFHLIVAYSKVPPRIDIETKTQGRGKRKR